MTGLPLDSQAQPIVVLPCPLLPQRFFRPLSHWAGAENLSGQEQSLLCARSLSRESLYVDVDVDVVDVDVVAPPGICASILSWGGARHLQGGGLMFNVWVVLMF